AAFAALKVSLWRRMSAVATGIFILTGDNEEGREDNRIRLRLFCFLPVNLSFIVAFAPLKVSLWRRMSAVATGIFILTKRQHPHFAWLVRMFSLRATLSGRAGTKLRQEDKLRREDNNLTSQEARSVVFSPVKIKFPVATADMRRHSDTLRGANATTKTRFTGRKQNKRSEFCCLPVVPRKGG
ncbi:MAG: hypothetical protein PT943_02190, partial [Ruminococcus sp.]|nr:hypothetical protein [Ruminococcus sp.]